jgi:hypothetical protein
MAKGRGRLKGSPGCSANTQRGNPNPGAGVVLVEWSAQGSKLGVEYADCDVLRRCIWLPWFALRRLSDIAA